jgi:hypothetical protein
MSTEIKLAWALADAASTCFTDADHISVYTALGAGEAYTAIVRTLAIAVRARYSLPTNLILELTTWLDGYAGHTQHQRLDRVMPLDAKRRNRLRGLRREGSRSPRRSTADRSMARLRVERRTANRREGDPERRLRDRLVPESSPLRLAP